MNFTLQPNTEIRITRAFDVREMQMIVRLDCARVGVLYEPKGVESCAFIRNRTDEPISVLLPPVPDIIVSKLQEQMAEPLKQDETRGIFTFERNVKIADAKIA